MRKLRYIFLLVMLTATISVQAKEVSAKPAHYPVVVFLKPVPKEKTPVFLPIMAFLKKQYRAVPAEDLNPIEWVDPWQTKERVTFSWKPIVDTILETGDYPNVDYMLILGMIAQETGGYNDAECNDFDTERGTCAVGLMAVSPAQCGFTEEQLKNPAINIGCGIYIINIVYDQAIEHGFRPGREATRAALAAYNCSWPSVLANKCFSFGGFTYSDKIFNYWIYHLTLYEQGV